MAIETCEMNETKWSSKRCQEPVFQGVMRDGEGLLKVCEAHYLEIAKQPVRHAPRTGSSSRCGEHRGVHLYPINSHYLSDTLACFDGTVSMEWASPSSQALFSSTDGDRFRAIVMPMWVQW